ncbi:Outer membrane protein W precursor [Candidatus Burkholderia pumila]|uniref:Outer membrane protein W n=1 Tax=Candidatus Burkholderia pumila TaxID=1090375 RepID=A0ABR5HM76_9BURK|nr:Outer membrane protein W precursor [Candidatus Burkholderia pumila]
MKNTPKGQIDVQLLGQFIHGRENSSFKRWNSDWLVCLRAISIMPQVSTGGALSTLNVDVNNAIVPELDFTYMIRDDIGVELILGTSRHQVTLDIGGLGGVSVLPPTLLLQYHFNHAGKIPPYVGAGVSYTYFYNDKFKASDTPVSIRHSSFGPALQAGVDVQVTKTLFVNADLKKTGCARAHWRTARISAR